MSVNPIRQVLIASQTTTTSSHSPDINLPTGNYHSCILLLDVSAASGTSPTLNVYVQNKLIPAASTDLQFASPTGTAVYDDFASFTQVAGTGDWVIRALTYGTSAGNVVASGSLSAGTVRVGPIGNTWRVNWVLTATTPSFTWSLVAELYPF